MNGRRPVEEPNGPTRANAAPSLAPEVRLRAGARDRPAREPDPVWVADERDLDLL